MKYPERIDDEFYYKYCQLIENLSRLPHKILQHHHIDALSQMILHELGHDDCFSLKKAVYLVDNPDFDHLIGAAGFCKNECKHHKTDLWKAPTSFVKDMQDASFHNDVKNFMQKSLKRKEVNIKDENDVKHLGEFVGIEDPQAISWGMKHGNHGILIFEGDKNLPEWSKDMLRNSVALLSLCGF